MKWSYFLLTPDGWRSGNYHLLGRKIPWSHLSWWRTEQMLPFPSWTLSVEGNHSRIRNQWPFFITLWPSPQGPYSYKNMAIDQWWISVHPSWVAYIMHLLHQSESLGVATTVQVSGSLIKEAKWVGSDQVRLHPLSSAPHQRPSIALTYMKGNPQPATTEQETLKSRTQCLCWSNFFPAWDKGVVMRSSSW